MRITTGLYRGRVIRTVNDLSVRPATDRVRQTIFNMLANRMELEGARVLDLFAGSGSLGIEALSRGAKHVLFIERDEEPARLLGETLRTFGAEASAEVLVLDAMSFLLTTTGVFDLVFADPPYGFGQTGTLPSILFDRHLLSPNGYLLIEHEKALRFESTPEFTAGPEKRFGGSVVTFFHTRVSPG